MSTPNATPIPPKASAESDPTLTVDTFMGEVPVDAHRSILVFRRQHGGRNFIRWREFHRHRKAGNWYPDKWRSFVIPLATGEALASAIAAAGRGEPFTAKPDWLAAIDQWREHRYRMLVDLNAPLEYLQSERRTRRLAYGMGRTTSPFARAERARVRTTRRLAKLERAQRLLAQIRGVSQ